MALLLLAISNIDGGGAILAGRYRTQVEGALYHTTPSVVLAVPWRLTLVELRRHLRPFAQAADPPRTMAASLPLPQIRTLAREMPELGRFHRAHCLPTNVRPPNDFAAWAAPSPAWRIAAWRLWMQAVRGAYRALGMPPLATAYEHLLSDTV